MSSAAPTRAEPSGGGTPGWAGIAAAAALLGIGCYLAQLLSIALRFPPTRITTIWLPGGLLLAVLLVAPLRRWWVYLFTAAAGLAAAFTPDAPPPTLIPFLVLICGSFAAVAAVLRRLTGGPPQFAQVRHVFLFLMPGGLALPVVAALGTAVIVVATGWREDFWQVWPTLVLAAVVGLVTVTPVTVAAAIAGVSRLRSAAAGRRVESVALSLAVVGVSATASGGESSAAGLSAVWLLYAPLPLLLYCIQPVERSHR